jgi:hypothetical protein
MEDLRITDDSISFMLRPQAMFAAPVPLQYRSAMDIPAETLEKWTGPSLAAVRTYAGTRTVDRLVLEGRVFVRLGDPALGLAKMREHEPTPLAGLEQPQ